MRKMTANGANGPDQPLILGRSPRFSASIATNRLLLSDEAGAHILEGPIYVAIASALAPEVSWDQLRADLSARHPLHEIQAALTVLAQIGYARRLDGTNEPGREAWWEALGAEPAPRTVSLEPLCATGLEYIAEALRSCDVTISPGAGLLLVLTDDYLRPELGEINRRGEPWLLAKVVGYRVWLGPLFVPGRTACWECLAWWLRPHRWKQWVFHGWRDGQYPSQPSVAHLGATLATAAGMIATVIAAVLAGGESPELEDAILTFDTRTLRQSRHCVRPIPACPVCGAGASEPPADLRSFVSEITGIVSGVELSDRPAAGLFHARSSFVNPLPRARVPDILFPGEAFGKGVDAEAAGDACIAEALERYSYAWQGNEAVVCARLADLDAISPNALGQYSDAQFRDRAANNRDSGSMFWIPVPFDPETRVGWLQCRPVHSGGPRFVLAAAAFFGYPFETEERYFIPDSNGCAAARTVEEALASALFELIERDGLAIWWYNRARRPAPSAADLDDENISAIVEALAREDRSVDVLDVTTDVKIPVYVAVSARLDGSDVVFGSAAHVCPRKAIYKALSEVSQIVYWKGRLEPNPELAQWLKGANTLAPGFEWLTSCRTVAPPPPRRRTAAEMVAECAAKLQDVGIEAYWTDLTRPETGVPVVRAIAPGLRNPWARFAPGRLYDTPVRLGWRSGPISEADLNPIRCMV
jgi:bacteriocin biosynthesis cyclodehydratase domain-containing protein